MRCIICKRLFNLKRGFTNLLVDRKEQVCDVCYNKYKLKIAYTEIPIGKGVKVYSLFPKKYMIPDNAFVVETSRIFSYILNTFNPKVILIYNNFYLSERQNTILEQISTLFESEIYILCNYMSD